MEAFKKLFIPDTGVKIECAGGKEVHALERDVPTSARESGGTDNLTG